MVLVAVVAVFINIPIFYYFNEPFAYLLMVIDVSYFVMYLMIKNHLLKYTTSSNIIIFIFFIHMLSIPAMNGNDTFVMNWIILYPIVVFGLKNHIDSIIHSILFLSVFYVMYYSSLLHESYSFLDVTMVGMMYVVLTILLYLIIKNIELNEKELKELNNTLEIRISDAINKNREKEKFILQQNRLAQMGEMLSMIAHQWRQPLNIISLNTVKLDAAVLLNDAIDKENIKHISEAINKQSQYLSHTIDDFRNFFKPNKGASNFVVADMVQHALKLSESIFSQNDIVVKKYIDVKREIFSFESELIQVLLNIIKNATDALAESDRRDKKIVISISEEYDGVLISIEDNAGGVPDVAISKIFDPYFSTKSIKGTGLGLYMSKIIVEDHCEGVLSFFNTKEGACFNIKLPFSIKD